MTKVRLVSHKPFSSSMNIDIEGKIISSGDNKIEIISDDLSKRITLILSDILEYKGVSDSFIIAKQTIIKNPLTNENITHSFNNFFIMSKVKKKIERTIKSYSDDELLKMYDFTYLMDIEEELERLEDLLLAKSDKLEIKYLINPFKQINKYIVNIGCFVNVNLVFSILIKHLEKNKNFSEQQKKYIFNLLNYFIIDFRNNLQILLTDFLGMYNPKYSTDIEYLKNNHHKGENTIDLLIQKNSKLMEGFFFQMINDLDNIINPPEEYEEGDIEFF